MSNNLQLVDFFDSLNRWGLADVLLPFLLVFTIVFAVLEKVKILGDKKNFNVIFALVMAFSTVLPHVTNSYPINFDPVDIINGALPSVSILVVAIMMLLVIIGVFAHDKIFLGLAAPGWIAFISIVAIVFIFGASAGFWGQGGLIDGLQEFFGEDAVAVVIMILVFAVIIGFITSDTKDKGIMEKIGFNFKQLFEGKGK